ncbi:MAG: LysR family transcriptional regulator [Halothiobacillaceae bacterium]|nr:MAG: LysR family transcriptional regulator [Halothiobacillaceae bacterium]
MASLNYKHLYYFWVVAKEGSVIKAAEKLHLTPQTISGQIGMLEEAIGIELFVKHGRNIILTESGQLTLGYANEIFLLGTELEEVLKNRPTGQPLQFNVGIADVVPKIIAHRLLEPALRLPENIRIVCIEDKLDSLLADIAIHKLDVVIADTPMRHGTHVRAFNHLLGECGTTFFAKSELAAHYRHNFPHSLDGAPILFPTKSSAIRSSLMRWFDQLQIRPYIAGEFDDSALMKAFGQAGVGLFTAPTVIKKEVIRQYEVEEIGAAEEIKEQFYAISAERKLKHPAVVAVCDAARQRLFLRPSTP